MKQFRYFSMILAGLTSLLLMSGCVHEFPEEGEPATSVKCYIHLRYKLGDMPLLTTVPYNEAPKKSRAADGAEDFRYLIRIMDDDDNVRRYGSLSRGVIEEIRLTVPATAEGETPDRTFEVTLPAGSYNIVAWSDFTEAGSADDKYYETSDMRYVTIIPGSDGAHPGATESRQAFRGTAAREIRAGELGEEKRIDIYVDMERPLAKFRFIATDVNEFLTRGSRSLGDYYAVVRYPTYMPNVFNVRLDKPTNSLQGQAFRSEIMPLTDGVAQLGFDYVFVNHADASVQLAIDIYERSSNRRMSSSDVVTAPLRRDHVTEIRGRFFTTDAQGGVGVDPGFNGDYNIVIK